MPACCMASWKSCWFDTAFMASSTEIFSTYRSFSSDWSKVIMP